MKQPKAFLLLSIVVAVLVLGIAYAAISDVAFNITGTAAAEGLDANFKVAFKSVNVTEAETSGQGKITYTAADQTASFAVTGLTTKDQFATVTLTIENKSTDINALLKSVVVSNDNEQYFEVTHNIENITVLANGEANITVTVKLIKNPVADQTANIKVTFAAEPVAA